MLKYARVTGWGKYLPDKVVTNQELEKKVNTSDTWIQTRTGIKERRLAADDEVASDMAIKAAKDALAVAGVKPEQLDLVIVATVTPEMIFPSCASLVQHAIGAKNAAAFDLNAACNGFVSAVSTASQYIGTGTYKKILVVGSEVYSRILDWTDRGTCVLFGDGAGAVVLETGDGPAGFLSFNMGSDGSKPDILYLLGICGAPANKVDDNHYISMNGSEVYKVAVRSMTKSCKKALADAGLTINDVNLLVPHQANKRIIQAVGKKLGLNEDKVFLNVQKYGNTSAASIPIALCEAVEQGLIKDNDNIVFVAFGAGLSWGASVLKWGTGR
ncbi:MAG: ketoacyl-ACP synthase III [Chloroflexi bacterium]|nr:ketoacyl-ACP synthase III [Chloroflexota bacterium]MBT7080692.1 ketoacyl-ACP synthase III [Chloroflexota bacterium]MBT7290183.1 ketoacyl-ACP synthase III [Chloroflexota bacterium]